MNENDELLDLVDADDNIVGTIRRGDMVKVGYESDKGFVRFVAAFLVNTDGQIWVPIRGLHKSIAPGGCDFSVGEHVLAGETYAQAIERAFLEEAGMKVNAKDLAMLGKLSPTETKPSHETVFAYYMRGEDSPEYSPDEFTSADWVTPQELEAMLVSGPPTKSVLLPAFRLLQKHREK